MAKGITPNEEAKTCYWCWWHSFQTDRCMQNGKTIYGNDLDIICSRYTTGEQWDKKHRLKNEN